MSNMWMFFEDGTFYSSVLDEFGSDIRWVRTRDKRSAQQYAAFVGGYRDLSGMAPILELKGRDYAYRVESTTQEWGLFVGSHITASRATNFKSEVAANLGYHKGKRFLNALHDVWAVMFDFQNEEKVYTTSVKKKTPKKKSDKV